MKFWLHISKMLKIETIITNKIFWSLQVRICVYRTPRACFKIKNEIWEVLLNENTCSALN